MSNRRLRVPAGHYHLFHRVAPTVASTKRYFAQERLDVETSATGSDLEQKQGSPISRQVKSEVD